MKKYLLYHLINCMRNTLVNCGYCALLVLIVMSCKPDSAPLKISPDASDIERNYFQDYDSPKHKWGFIDVGGRVQVEPQFDDLKDYINGRCAANLGGRWGFLDKAGKNIIEHKYKQAYDFSDDGYALVQDFDNKWQIIDPEGTIISKLSASELSEVKYGHLVFSTAGLNGILDVSGKEIIEPTFISIKIYSAEHFIGRDGHGEALYDLSGQKISDTYDKIFSAKDGFLRARRDGLYYFLEEEGFDPLNKLGYKYAHDFNGDYSVIKTDAEFEIIDKQLNKIKKLNYKDVKSAGDGYWKYKQDRNWGLLSPRGDLISSDKFELLNRFSDNRIAYSINSQWGYLNKLGESVIGGNLALVWDFHDGRARMIGNRGVGFIDTTGQMVIKDRFFEVREFYNGLSRFQTF